MSKILIFALILTSPLFAADSGMPIEELKMEKRFGAGLGAAGGLSLMGVEIDVNITPVFSISGGIGTGGDYSTISLKGRYFLLGKNVSPYVALGFARWWTDGTRVTEIGPSVLKNRFLEGVSDYSKGFDVFIMYPAFGVQYLHASGLSVSAEIEYLFRLFDFSNGTYAGLGVHWYF